MDGKAALITGAAARIGKALALHLAAEGWDIGLHFGASEAEARQVEGEIRALGRACARYRADLREPAAAAGLAAAFRRDFPQGRLLINSASIFRRDRLASLDPAEFEEHMAVNALAPALLSRGFAEAAPAGSSIINLLDQKVDNLTPDFFSYTVSKCALLAITRMLAMELAPGVRVNAISPGLVLPSSGQSEAGFGRAHGATLLGVGPTVAEICAAASLLAASPSITGETIAIDGGRHLTGTSPPFDDLPRP